MKVKAIHDPRYARLIGQIRERRLALGIKQSELAARIEMSNRWLSKVELRDIRLDVMMFIRVCRALGARASRMIERLEEEEDAPDSSFSHCFACSSVRADRTIARTACLRSGGSWAHAKTTAIGRNFQPTGSITKMIPRTITTAHPTLTISIRVMFIPFTPDLWFPGLP